MQATCLVGSFLETDTKDIVISRAVIYAAFFFPVDDECFLRFLHELSWR